jgi:hypothetical protein
MAFMPHVSKSAAAQAWRNFFVALPDLLRSESDRRIQIEPDGSGPPAQLALREAFNAFPVLTDVLLLDTDGCPLDPGEERFWTLLNFDFSVTTGNLMRFHGTASASKIKHHAASLDTYFSLRFIDLGSLRGLLLMGQQYDHSLVHLVSYDARDQIERYSSELASYLLSCTGTLCRLFSKQTDFNERYGLPPDPMVDAKSLLKIHTVTAHFVDPTTGGQLTLERLQEEVSSIQLIPQVPEDIRRTFYLAKRLYVFGYLEYGFFTVSLHYAYAAMEAALHARWSAALPIPTVLTHKGNVETLGTGPTKHFGIRRLCRVRGWDIRSLQVNGEHFPDTAKKVAVSLHKLRIITDWQLRQFEHMWLRRRNYHSHLEFAPIETPQTDALVQVAREINQLFDSLPASG